MSKLPSYDNIKDVMVTSCESQKKTNDFIFHSKYVYGKWYGHKWLFDVVITHNPDMDENNDVYLKQTDMVLSREDRKISEIVDCFRDVMILANSTGTVFPQLIYMDTPPSVILIKGAYFTKSLDYR